MLGHFHQQYRLQQMQNSDPKYFVTMVVFFCFFDETVVDSKHKPLIGTTDSVAINNSERCLMNTSPFYY